MFAEIPRLFTENWQNAWSIIYHISCFIRTEISWLGSDLLRYFEGAFKSELAFLSGPCWHFLSSFGWHLFRTCGSVFLFHPSFKMFSFSKFVALLYRRVFILRAAPSAVGPHSSDEGCGLVACCASWAAILGSLIFGCLFFFCVRVKCVEASWLLLLDIHIAILAFSNLSFGRSCASTWAPWVPFWQLGDTLGGHGSSRKDMCRSGAIIWVISRWSWDPILKVFSAQMGNSLFFVRACLQVVFRIDCRV